MRRITPSEDWPASWQESYVYDQQEVYAAPKTGYALAYRNRRDQALRLLTEAVPPGSRVLDLAAAQGNFSLALAECGYRVTWNDLRADLIGYVQAKHEHGNITYAPGNAFELEFPALFDAVLFSEVIEHVAHPDKFMKQVAALLRPDGVAVMTTPNGRYFMNHLPRFSDCPDPSAFEAVQFKPNSDGHIFLLWPDEVVRLAHDAGLRVEEKSFFTTPL